MPYETQYIKCGDDWGFDIELIIEGENIILEDSTVSLKGQMSPDWYDIDGQVERVEEENGVLTLFVGSWSAANDDPYNYRVIMAKDLLLRPFKRSQQTTLEADGNEAVCYSYIKYN